MTTDTQAAALAALNSDAEKLGLYNGVGLVATGAKLLAFASALAATKQPADQFTSTQQRELAKCYGATNIHELILGMEAHILRLSQPAPSAPEQPSAAVGEFMGRRLTPKGTREFWGWLSCDREQDPPVGAKLYLAPPEPLRAGALSNLESATQFTTRLGMAVARDWAAGWDACVREVLATQPTSAAVVVPANCVAVPLEDLEAVSQALSNFVGTHGWRGTDMQAVLNIDAHIAQHNARAGATTQ